MKAKPIKILFTLLAASALYCNAATENTPVAVVPTATADTILPCPIAPHDILARQHPPDFPTESRPKEPPRHTSRQLCLSQPTGKENHPLPHQSQSAPAPILRTRLPALHRNDKYTRQPSPATPPSTRKNMDHTRHLCRRRPHPMATRKGQATPRLERRLRHSRNIRPRTVHPTGNAHHLPARQGQNRIAKGNHTTRAAKTAQRLTTCKKTTHATIPPSPPSNH